MPISILVFHRALADIEHSIRGICPIPIILTVPYQRREPETRMLLTTIFASNRVKSTKLLAIVRVAKKLTHPPIFKIRQWVG